MKVKELIALLLACDQELEVLLSDMDSPKYATIVGTPLVMTVKALPEPRLVITIDGIIARPCRPVQRFIDCSKDAAGAFEAVVL